MKENLHPHSHKIRSSNETSINVRQYLDMHVQFQRTTLAAINFLYTEQCLMKLEGRGSRGGHGGRN